MEPDYGDPEALVTYILRATLVAPVAVQDLPFPDLLAVVEHGGVRAHMVSRVAEHDGSWGYVERCVFAVDVWKLGRTAALQLAGLARSALRHAVAKPFPGGSISRYAENSAPVEFQTGIKLDGVYQFGALYELHICPPA